MQKNLCLSCAMDLAKRADIRSFGHPTHLGMCAACGDRMLVTAYDVPDIPAKAEKPEAKVMDAPAVPTSRFGRKLRLRWMCARQTKSCISRASGARNRGAWWTRL